MTFTKGQIANPKGRARRLLTAPELRKVEALAASGAHEYSIARVLGIDADTLRARKRDTPGLVDAIAAGRARWHDRHVGLLNAAAEKGQIIASMFLLKSRFGYREGAALEEGRAPVVINLPAASSLEKYTADVEAYTASLLKQKAALLEHKADDDAK